MIRYALRTPGEDFFKVNFVKLADCGAVPFAILRTSPWPICLSRKRLAVMAWLLIAANTGV